MEKSIKVTTELMGELKKMIDEAVIRSVESKVKGIIQAEVQTAYTQRVKIDFDGDMSNLRDEVREVRDAIEDVKKILIGDKEYGIDGLANQVKENSKFRERFIWTVGLSAGIAGILGSIIRDLISQLISGK